MKYITIEIPYILKNKFFGDNDLIYFVNAIDDWIWEKKNLVWIIFTLKFNGYKKEIILIKYLLFIFILEKKKINDNAWATTVGEV